MRKYPEPLREQANQLAMAQSCGIHDGYSWADAFEELTAENLWDDDAPATEAERFTPTCQFSGLTIGELAYYVETEAMAIYEELKKAYDLGRNEAEKDPGVKQLRARGYAVSLWTPDELEGRDQDEMEDHLARTGNEFLEFI